MSDDDAKRIILRRRARFIAAALATSGIASCDACGPKACLEPPPAPCLAVPIAIVDAGVTIGPPVPPDAATDDGAAADADIADAADAASDAAQGKKKAVGPAPPRPCLSTPPRPCLSEAF